MQNYEYKTVALNVTGRRKPGALASDLQDELNALAGNGWRVVNVLMPMQVAPAARSMLETIVVLERPIG